MQVQAGHLTDYDGKIKEQSKGPAGGVKIVCRLLLSVRQINQLHYGGVCGVGIGVYKCPENVVR